MSDDAAKRSARGRRLPDRGALQSLLVPIDLTPSSDRALGRISLLPLADEALVTILHVVPLSFSPKQQRAAERDASRMLEVESQHLRKTLPKGVSVQPLVVRGAAVKEIAARATKLKAELIVMGRGGGRALRDAFLGSTAERVIRKTRLPVLVVRLPPRVAYGRPALALDIDDRAAQEVVRHILRLLPPHRPRVAVIHAYEVPHAGVYPSLSDDDFDETENELQRKATRDVELQLSVALARLKVPTQFSPSWATHVREGSPSIVVEKFVRKTGTDLLVLGTRGYSGAAHLFLGTVSGELLREVKSDVLVVPPRGSG
jgi:nucleotide-binding universal stress UspA family protein